MTAPRSDIVVRLQKGRRRRSWGVYVGAALLEGGFFTRAAAETACHEWQEADRQAGRQESAIYVTLTLRRAIAQHYGVAAVTAAHVAEEYRMLARRGPGGVIGIRDLEQLRHVFLRHGLDPFLAPATTTETSTAKGDR